MTGDTAGETTAETTGQPTERTPTRSPQDEAASPLSDAELAALAREAPRLVAEIQRLRAELAEEQALHNGCLERLRVAYQENARLRALLGEPEAPTPGASPAAPAPP